MHAFATAAPLRIATVSAEPAQDIKEFQPLANYLGSRLNAHGIDSAVVVVAQDIPHMTRLLQSGAVDLYIDSPLPVLMTQREAGNVVALRRWKRGVSNYAGLIFVRADSGINDLRQLAGKHIAFEEPISTGSYFLPKVHLRKAGLKMNAKGSSQEVVDKNELGYVFSNDDRNTLAWVLRGLVSAGAMNDEKFAKLAAPYKDSLRVLTTTPSVPRHLVTLRKNLDARLAADIQSLLLNMENTPEGRQALKDFNDTTRFDRLPPEDQKTLDDLRRSYEALMREELSGRGR